MHCANFGDFLAFPLKRCHLHVMIAISTNSHVSAFSNPLVLSISLKHLVLITTQDWQNLILAGVEYEAT